MKKAKYKRQVAIGYDSTGKRVRKWVYANTKAELEKKTLELLANFQCCEVPLDTKFNVYAERWLNVYKSNRAGNTQAMYKQCLKLTEKIDEVSVSDITPTDLQEIINDNWEHAETCKKLKMTLKAIFKKAVSDGLISRNPAQELEVPKVVQKEKRALSKDEIEAVKRIISTEDARLSETEKMFVICLYYFGMRPEEVRGLMKADFDFEKETVTVQRALAYVDYKPTLKNTKTGNKRVIPIPTAALQHLKKYVETHDSLYLFNGVKNPLLSKKVYLKMWRHIKSEINILLGGNDKLDLTNGLTPYTFRRNFATRLYYSNISIKKAAYFMGHCDTKMILQVYAQIDDEKEDIQALKSIV